MLCFPLLFAGIPMSTYRIGESVSQKAIVRMFPSATSLMGCRQFTIIRKENRQINLKEQSSKYNENLYNIYIAKI